MSTYMIRYKGKLIYWTASNSESQSIYNITISSGRLWEDLQEAGYEAVEVVPRDAALAATPNQPPAPFALVWDGQMGSLRRRDGFTIIATMSERTYKRIKQAQDDGADFYTLKAMFPKKHSVYNA